MIYNSSRALELLRLGSGLRDATFHDGQEEAIRHIVEGSGRLLVVQRTLPTKQRSPALPLLPTAVNAQLVHEATEFLRGLSLPIEPRKKMAVRWIADIWVEGEHPPGAFGRTRQSTMHVG